MSAAVLCQLRDGIAQLTLNRPGHLNRLDSGMADALVAAAQRAVTEGVGAVLLTGSGCAFCAGGESAIALDDCAADGSIDAAPRFMSGRRACQAASAVPS